MIKKIKIILEMIKFEHTIFALPFAFTGALLAADGLPPWRTVLWITAAMFGARSAAMGFNRWADRSFDAGNPRTKNRALPMRLITPTQVIIFTAASSALLIFAAYMLNPLSLSLARCAGSRIFLLLHETLHVSVARLSRPRHLSLADRRLDRGHRQDRFARARARRRGALLAARLRRALCAPGHGVRPQGRPSSIPERFGIRCSLWISRASHALTMAALLWLSILLSLGWLYLAGVFLALCLIVYEHTLVKEHDLSQLDVAFFNMNGYISVTVFLFTLMDRLV